MCACILARSRCTHLPGARPSSHLPGAALSCQYARFSITSVSTSWGELGLEPRRNCRPRGGVCAGKTAEGAGQGTAQQETASPAQCASQKLQRKQPCARSVSLASADLAAFRSTCACVCLPAVLCDRALGTHDNPLPHRAAALAADVDAAAKEHQRVKFVLGVHHLRNHGAHRSEVSVLRMLLAALAPEQ